MNLFMRFMWGFFFLSIFMDFLRRIPSPFLPTSGHVVTAFVGLLSTKIKSEAQEILFQKTAERLALKKTVSFWLIFMPFSLRERGQNMSKEYKTSQRKRTNYIYYLAEGGQIIITPGENGVTEADIELLHSIDDNEVDEQRRYNYRFTAHLDAYKNKTSSDLCLFSLFRGNPV